MDYFHCDKDNNFYHDYFKLGNCFFLVLYCIIAVTAPPAKSGATSVASKKYQHIAATAE